MTISIPAGVTSVEPMSSASWAVGPQVAGSDVEGGTIVTYRAVAPLPEGTRGEFELQLRLPEAAGTTLAFPTVQTCASGESAWIEVPAAGQAAAELQLPAPTITLTDGAPGTPASPSNGPAAPPQAATPPSASRATDVEQPPRAAGVGGSGIPAAAMAAGAAGLVAGGGLVLRRRRR